MSGKGRIAGLWICLLGLFPSWLSAQSETSEKIKPRWVQKRPEPSNSTFTYEVETAYAATLDEAREKALAELMAHSGLENGVVVLWNNRSEERLSQVYENGRLTERIEYTGKTLTESRGEVVKLHVSVVAEYWKKDKSGHYYVTRLYAKSRMNQVPHFDAVEPTAHYGGRGLWRSMLIPGWGQFYKGSTMKGCFLLGGCAVLAGGIVFTENQRSDYIRKRGQTHDIHLIRSYSTRADHFASARNLCIGAAAALYVYNLIDALVAPGASRIVRQRKSVRARSYVFSPAVLPDGTTGITAMATF